MGKDVALLEKMLHYGFKCCIMGKPGVALWKKCFIMGKVLHYG